MKQRILVLLMIVGLIAVLVVLNAASYVQTQRTDDTEASPNRSTYNPGPTGTQALFSLLKGQVLFAISNGHELI